MWYQSAPVGWSVQRLIECIFIKNRLDNKDVHPISPVLSKVFIYTGSDTFQLQPRHFGRFDAFDASTIMTVPSTSTTHDLNFDSQTIKTRVLLHLIEWHRALHVLTVAVEPVTEEVLWLRLKKKKKNRCSTVLIKQTFVFLDCLLSSKIRCLSVCKKTIDKQPKVSCWAASMTKLLKTVLNGN